MSILPSHSHTDNHTAASSSSISTNPNSNHGSEHQQQQQQQQYGSSHNLSGNLVTPAYPSSTGSSKKVNDSSSSRHGRHNPPRDRNTAARSAPRRNHMVSGNHLLNFHYDPISRPQSRLRLPPLRRGGYLKRKPYNKDLFLQANYKFVLLDSGNYAPHSSIDPDKMLQWEDIVCVRYSTPFHVQCPICLEDPLCPQITSCGHIFCFPCIMQYFIISEEDDHKDDFKKKCPLCFMMISSKDLYTIQIENVKQHRVGDVIEFSLLTRNKDSFTLSLKNNDGIVGGEEVQKSFSKFTFTSDVDLSVREAMSDLHSWLARADSGLVDDMEKLPFVCAAMEQLEQRKKYWNMQHIAVQNRKSDEDNCFDKCSYSSQATESVQAHSAGQSTPEMASSHPNDKPILQEKSSLNKIARDSQFVQAADFESIEDCIGSSLSLYDYNKSLQKDTIGITNREEISSYSFYQAVDGQHLILHPLNMKCLLHYYGGYDSLPNRISGKILQMESVTQSEAMRRRYRFLSHFSLTTTFQLCEIDISKMLPMDALSPFMEEIKSREKQRKWLARKERREQVKAEAIGMHSEPLPFSFSEPSFTEEPNFTSNDFEALGSTSVTSSSSPVPGGKQLFSNVARLGFAAGCDPPALKMDESACDSSVAAGTRSSGIPSFANVTSKAKAVEGPNASKSNDAGKRGKKPNRILMSTYGGPVNLSTEEIRILSHFQSNLEQCVANRGLGLTAHIIDHCNLILKFPQGTNSTWYNEQFKIFEPLEYKYDVCEAILLWEQYRNMTTVLTREYLDSRPDGWFDYAAKRIAQLGADKCYNQTLCEEHLNLILPAKPPFHPRQFRRCAVVGNSGDLLRTQFGEEIDNHDAIIRDNEAPVNEKYAKHVGLKRDFRLVVRGAARNMIKILNGSDNEVLIIKSVIHRDFNAMIKKIRNPVYLFQGIVLRRGAKGTGMKSIELALSMCDIVDIYGFTVDPGYTEWTRYFSTPRKGHNPLQGRAYYQLLECLGVIRIHSPMRAKRKQDWSDVPSREMINNAHRAALLLKKKQAGQEGGLGQFVNCKVWGKSGPYGTGPVSGSTDMTDTRKYSNYNRWEVMPFESLREEARKHYIQMEGVSLYKMDGNKLDDLVCVKHPPKS